MTRKTKIIGAMLLLFFLVVFAVGEDACIICGMIADEPQAELLLTMDDVDYEIGAYLYYENFTSEPPRMPIEDTLLFVYVIPAEGENELLKIFTDEDGQAVFDFSEYAENAQEEQISYNFRIIYCPFCHPEDEGYPCGFDECVDYSGIAVPPGIGGTNPVASIPLAEGEDLLPEGDRNRDNYLPTSASITYSPPPPPTALVPGFCFPLLLIFAMLGGALYYSGKNPFSAFTLGSPRIGKHIRYTPGGRGVRFSGRYIASSIKRGVGEAKEIHAARVKARSEGESAAKAGWEAGVEPASWQDTLTLGIHGSLKSARAVVKGGEREITTAGPKGGVGEKKKVKVPSAKERLKQIKGELRTSTVELFQPGKAGVTGKGKTAKMWFKQLGKALAKTGLLLFNNSFLGEMGLNKMTERALEAMRKDQVTLNAAVIAAGDILSEKGKVVGTEVHLNEEGLKIDKKTGTVTLKGPEGFEDVEINLSQQQLEEGKKTGSINLEKDGKKVSIELNNGGISGVKWSSGKGADRLETRFNVDNAGTVISTTVTVGEGKNAISIIGSKNAETGKAEILAVQNHATGEITTFNGENAQELNNMAPEKAVSALNEALENQGASVMETAQRLSGLDNNGFNKINDKIDQNVTIDTTVMIGPPGERKEVVFSQGTGAEPGEYSKAVEVNADGTKTEINLDKNGNITGTTAISKDGTRTPISAEKGVYALPDGSTIEHGSAYGALNKVAEIRTAEADVFNAHNAAVLNEQMDAIDTTLKKIPGLEDSTRSYTERYNEGIESLKLDPEAELLLRSEGVEPGTMNAAIYEKIGTPPGEDASAQEKKAYAKNFEATAKEVATEYYTRKADQMVINSGDDLIQGKISKETPSGEEPREPTNMEMLGADMVASMGTSLASMEEKEASAIIESKINGDITLTSAEKKEALETALSLLPDAQKVATEYKKGAEEAGAAQPEYMRIQASAMNSFNPMLGGIEEEYHNDVMKQLTAEIAKVNMTGNPDDVMIGVASAAVTSTMDNPAPKKIIVGNKQQHLADIIDGRGALKPPTVSPEPIPPKPPPEIRQSVEEHAKKLGDELYYNLEARDYNAEVEKYNSALKAKDPEAPTMPNIAIAPDLKPNGDVLDSAVEKLQANPENFGNLTEKEQREYIMYASNPDEYLKQAQRSDDMVDIIKKGKIPTAPPLGPEEVLLFDIGKKEFDDYRKKYNKEHPDAKIPAPPKPPKKPKTIAKSEKDLGKMIKKQEYETELKKYYQKKQQHDIEMMTYDARMEQYRNEILYGSNKEVIMPDGKTKKKHTYGGIDALVASSVLLGAMKKGKELPDDIYKRATEAAANGDTNLWRQTAMDAAKYMTKEKKKKRKKELQSLKDEKELGL